MRAFCVFEVFCNFKCVLDPYEDLYPFEFWGSFAVLDHYVYNWSLPGIYTLLRFWGRLRRLDHHEFFDLYEYFNYPFEFLTSFMAFRPLRVVWPSRLFRPFCVFLHRFVCKTPFEFDIAFAVFIPLRVCVWPFGVYIPFWVYTPFWPLWPPIDEAIFQLNGYVSNHNVVRLMSTPYWSTWRLCLRQTLLWRKAGMDRFCEE